MTRIVSILLPAHDEAAYIETCLKAVVASDPLPKGWRGEVLVVANGCSDDTAARARSVCGAGAWTLKVLERPDGGKLRALNSGEAAASGEVLIYLDADVIVGPGLLNGLVRALDSDHARYAGGAPRVAPAQSWITRAYGRFWTRLPFMQTGTPGFGIFAMNRIGRARWAAWPDIISDDTFARLNFASGERTRVEEPYTWPLVEGFARLVRVRRRQDAGVSEIKARFPELERNDDKRSLAFADVMRLFVKDPVGFCVYAAVSLAIWTPLYRGTGVWVRGR